MNVKTCKAERPLQPWTAVSRRGALERLQPNQKTEQPVLSAPAKDQEVTCWHYKHLAFQSETATAICLPSPAFVPPLPPALPFNKTDFQRKYMTKRKGQQVKKTTWLQAILFALAFVPTLPPTCLQKDGFPAQVHEEEEGPAGQEDNLHKRGKT